MNKEDKYMEALQEANKNSIIDSLYTQNTELKLRIKILENICDKLNDYISDNNLEHKRFITEEENISYYEFLKELYRH